MPTEPFAAVVSITGGPPGPAGTAATVQVGSTNTGAPGTSAVVLNSGSTTAAILDFTIPKGDKGDTGEQGEPGAAGAGSGDVIGPGVAVVNNHVVTWDGTTGTAIKDSGATLTGTNTGDQTITLTGAVTGSGTGSFATTIPAASIAYAKIQNVSATDRLLGRQTSGAGSAEEIVCTAAGRALIDDTDAAAQRTTLSLVVGTNVQAFDSDLAAIAALTTDAFGRGLLPLTDGTAVRTYIGAGSSSFDGTFTSLTGKPTTLGGYGITDVTVTAGKIFNVTNNLTLSGTDGSTLAIGTGGTLGTAAYTAATVYQPVDAELSALAGLTSASDKLPYFTGSGTASLADFTTAGRALVDDADATAQRTTLGLGTLATQSGTFSGTSSGTNTGDQTITLTGDVTGSGTGSFAATLANIPTATPAVGTILHTNIAAPSSPAAGKVSAYSDSTDLRFHDKNASGVIGTTVVADTGASNNFLTAISAAGAISKAQPAFSNLSGSVATTQMPALTGDVTTSAGAVATTIANNAVTTAKILDANVTYAKIQNVSATDKVLGRSSSGSGVTEEITCTAAGRALIDDAAAINQRATLGLTNATIRSVGFTVDGGGTAIATGKVKGFFTCPFAGAITAWNIMADTGTATVQVWKVATGTAVPTSGNIISTTPYQQLTTGTALHSTDLSKFSSTTVTANDIFAFNISTISGPTELSFNIEITTSV